ncbi:MAG: S8 family serine peptidase [Thermoleophilia bacterium]|nr:S8 family serine peptidase [Thermoleophilia bacterium]
MGSPRNTRRAAAAAAMLAGALALAAPAAMAAPSSETVLVKFDPAATRAERADVAGALDAVSGRGLLGGWRAYRLDDPVTLAQAKAALAGTTADLGVQIDRPVRPLAAATDPSWGSQWDMTTIGAPEAWDLAPGVPVIVATTDTGVDISHPELAGRVWVNTGEIAANGLDDDHNGYVDDVNGWDFRNNDAGVFDGAAVDTHGTHVAGTIAASRDNGVGIAGLSSTARLMPVKFMEDASGGTFMNGVLAIQYAVDHGARVINASWGSSSYWQPMCDAVQAAVNRGVLFVAAAGNDGLDEGAGVAYPAACPSAGIVSVAATTGTDHLAAFSNRGATTVDLGAPGESIYSLAPGSGYSWKSGTSMAAPHVAGVAAMLLGRHPSLGVADLKSLLMDTGAPAAALAGTTVSGRRLSASAAMSAADAPDTTPPTAPVITSPAAGAVVNDATVTWTGSTDASGIDGYRVTVDGTVVGNVGSGVRSLDPGPLADGPHSVTVTAADTAGNTTAGTAVPFTLDTRPPAAFTMTAPAATAATEVTVTWTPSSDDNGIARYRVRWDGGAVTLGATATRLPFALPVGGGFEVTVAADDPAGNTTSVTATILPQPVPDRVVPDPPSVAPAPAPAKKPVYRLVRRCKKTVKRVRVGRVFVKRSVRTCTTVRVRVGVR